MLTHKVQFGLVELIENIVLEPFEEYVVNCSCSGDFINNKTYLFLPNMDKMFKRGVVIASAVVTPFNSEIPVRICNSTNEEITLYVKTRVGRMEECVTVGITEGNIRMTVGERNNNTHLKLLKGQILKNVYLSRCEKQATCQLLEKYGHIFSKTKDDIGYCPYVKHEIFVKDTQPIHDSMRRIPMGLEGQVDEMVDNMLNKNIIRPSESPWNAALVVVKKKDGNIRLCVDYRNLNSVTIRPVYPIPEAKHLFDTLAGSQYFSAIDLSSAYYQCEVVETDKEKTAFATRKGHFEFNRMPFRLCGAPATFQRLMHVVLKAENWSSCLVYLDDILIFGKDYSEHLKRLETIFKKLSEAGIKLSPEKCSLFKRELKFLGHIVTSEGIKADEEKISKVISWPKPTNIEELRSFLGFSNYYRRFIKGYSNLTMPLEGMMKDSAKGNINKMKRKLLNWSDETEAAFLILKQKLTSAPVLAYPNNTDLFILDTDASHSGMGAVLSQIQNCREKVIEYASRKFTKSEIKYCVTRKELLAVYSFVTQFRHYLLGKRFIIRTDHRPLIWMLNWEQPNTSQYCRWIAELEQYNFSIEHRPGKLHANADGLSRLFQCEQCEFSHSLPVKRRNVKILRCYSEEKSYLNLVKNYHQELGHVGTSKTYEKLLADGHNWKGIYNDVKNCISSCVFCAERKEGPKPRNKEYKIAASYPFEKVMIDITGPLFPPSRYGHSYILGIVDVFSRYSMLIPLKRTDSEAIMNAIFKNWISIFGYPKFLISDNAANLSSSLITEFCSKYQIQKVNCSPYYPQGNGIIERLFRTAKDMIYATSKQRGIDWIDSLPYIEMGLRSTVSSATGYSPHEIIFGFRLSLPWCHSLKNISEYSTELEFVKDHERRIGDLHRLLQSATQYEAPNSYEVGDLVMVRSVKEKGLLKPKYFGPCKVIEALGRKLYRLDYNGYQFKRNQYHLKKFKNNAMKRKDIRRNSVDAKLSVPATRGEKDLKKYPQRIRSSIRRYGFNDL